LKQLRVEARNHKSEASSVQRAATMTFHAVAAFGRWTPGFSGREKPELISMYLRS
jgi:hypothetical protein